jgi:hypothetical protein
MKFAFEIKTKPVTQAAIIVAVIAFSTGSLLTTNGRVISRPAKYSTEKCILFYVGIKKVGQSQNSFKAFSSSK